MSNETRYCLLIGNSRWHWAKATTEGWKFSHTPPSRNLLRSKKNLLVAWAAVGNLPLELNLDPAIQMEVKKVPIKMMPSWLGIDRALGAWGALQRLNKCDQQSPGVLIADAGTVLSITRVSSDGAFAGGQLVGGLRLQLSSMELGTQNLVDPGFQEVDNDAFPFDTAEAMRQGSFRALIGMLIDAQAESRLPLWLCGGDSGVLFKELRRRGLEVAHFPDLVLEGMVDLYDLLN